MSGDAVRRRASVRIGEIIPVNYKGTVARCADCPAVCFCWDDASAERWAEQHVCSPQASS